jgi:hypothetical protein
MHAISFLYDGGTSVSFSGNLTLTNVGAPTSQATQLILGSLPSSTVTAGASFGFTVAAEDSQGNIITGFNGTVTVALATNPGGSTLGGTLVASATNGIATFSGVTLNKVGSGYILAVSTSGLASSTSSALAVVPGIATQVVITGQPPASVTAGSAFGLTATVEDAQGNVVPNYNGSAVVSLANNSGLSILSGATSVVFTNGVAALSGLGLNKSGTSYTLQIASGSLTTAVSRGFTVAPGAATHLVVIGQPTANATAGTAFTYTVAAEDAQGNVATGYSGNVAVALASNPGSSTLAGTLSAVVSAGVARFSDSLNKTGTGYTLLATSGSLASATTSSIAVIAGAASKMIISSQPPATVTAGSAFGMTALVEDSLGNLATSYMRAITVGLQSNPGSGTLSGTLSLRAVGGVVTFSPLTVNKAANGYNLLVSSLGLSAATSSSFSVLAGAATQLVFSASPPANVTSAAPFGMTLKAEDAQGNPVSSFTGVVTVSLATNPGGSSLGGTLTAKASGGVAIFTGLTLNTAATGYKLQASTSGLSTATTAKFNVVAGAATHLVVTTPPLATVTAGTSFSYNVSAEDAQGNLATSFNSTLSVAIGNNPGGSTLGGTVSVAMRSGVAKLTNSLNQLGVGYTLQISASGVSPATTGSITVGAAHLNPAGGVAPVGSPAVPALTTAQLMPIVSESILIWSLMGITRAQVSALKSATFTITDTRSQGALALTTGTSIKIDPTADGYGWSVDGSLFDSPAAGRMDLLTTVMHELGHVLGLPDVSPLLDPNDLMDLTLPTGVRHLPSAADIDMLFAGYWPS